MELLRDAEPVVEGTALLLEEAGMGLLATSLRSGLPLATLDAALAVADILKEAQAHEELSELAFWAEGAILAGCEGDIDLFSDCILMCERAASEAWLQFAVH
jgi:hypothetical protein